MVLIWQTATLDIGLPMVSDTILQLDLFHYPTLSLAQKKKPNELSSHYFALSVWSDTQAKGIRQYACGGHTTTSKPIMFRKKTNLLNFPS